MADPTIVSHTTIAGAATVAELCWYTAGWWSLPPESPERCDAAREPMTRELKVRWVSWVCGAWKDMQCRKRHAVCGFGNPWIQVQCVAPVTVTHRMCAPQPLTRWIALLHSVEIHSLSPQCGCSKTHLYLIYTRMSTLAPFTLTHLSSKTLYLH